MASFRPKVTSVIWAAEWKNSHRLLQPEVHVVGLHGLGVNSDWRAAHLVFRPDADVLSVWASVSDWIKVGPLVPEQTMTFLQWSWYWS